MRHKVMATLGGYQQRVVLRDKCWIDEMYIEDSTLKDTAGYHAMRERLSRNLICVSVVIDAHKNPVGSCAVRQAERREGHIAEGTTIIHDKKRAHSFLVRALEGTSVAYKADTEDPDYILKA